MKQESQTNRLFKSIVSAAALGGVTLQGLPAHLRVINDSGDTANSLRRQFSKGKASKKKRGKA